MERLSAFAAIEYICRVASLAPAPPGEDLRARTLAMGDHWPQIIAASSAHLLTPALAFGLEKKELAPLVPADVREYMDAALTLNRRRNMDILRQALDLAEGFAKAGLSPIFMKGTANLASGLYGEMGQRIIGDIDILLEPGKEERTLHVLREMGYTQDEDPDFPDRHQHLPPMYCPGKIAPVEPHLLFLPHMESFLPGQAIFSQSERVVVADVRIRIPSPIHRICHNYLHAHYFHRPFHVLYLSQIYDYSLLAARFNRPEIHEKVFGLMDRSIRRYHLYPYDYMSHNLYQVSLAPAAYYGWSVAWMEWILFKLSIKSPAFWNVLFLLDRILGLYDKLATGKESIREFISKIFKARHYKDFFGGFRAVLF